MISAGRCNNGARTAVMTSDDCRVVNGGGGGGGYVNHCEQELDDKNEMVLAASKIAVAAGGIQPTVAADEGVYLASCAELANLKELTLGNLDLIDEFKVLLAHKDDKILLLTKEVEYLQKKLDEANQHIAEIAGREESLDVLPFTPVSSTCSSGMGDMSSAELHEQQEVKPKRRRIRQATIKRPYPDLLEPNTDPLEPNLTKRQRTRRNRTKSGDLGKMQELCLITADSAYYTCLGNYDPVKDEPVSENSNCNLEIPSWRVKTYSSWYSMEGTENMSDDVFENRHSKLEMGERKRKRWDMQRIRELKQVEYLKRGRYRHHSQNSNENDKEELTTLLPNPANIKAIEITDNLPVSAFGSNLLIKKKHGFYKFCHSRWCNDGSQGPSECNVRELRSSGRSQFYNST